jgi:hypothetical protein
MKKILLLLLLPLFSNAQTVSVWNTKANETHYQIRIENKTDNDTHGVFEFTIDELNTNELDYYVWGKWTLIDRGVYECKVKIGNRKDIFPKKFIVKRGESFEYNGIYIKWDGRYLLQ